MSGVPSVTGASASADDVSEQSTARSVGAKDDPAATSIRGKRGIELWLDDANDGPVPAAVVQPAGKPAKTAVPTAAAAEATASSNNNHAASLSPARSDASATPSIPLSVTGLSPNRLAAAASAPSPSSNATTASGRTPPVEPLSIEDQLKLLKEKRRARSTERKVGIPQQEDATAAAGGRGADSARRSVGSRESETGSGLASTTNSLSTPPVSVPPIDLISKPPQPPSARRGSTGSGKPPLPLSARKLVVGVPTPRTGRSGVTTPRSAIKPGDLPKAVKDLSSAEWKKQQDAMDLLRAALQGSSSMTDETRVVLRQNLHGLVTGTLACMDSGRSTLAKVATDMIGLICEKLGPRTAASPTSPFIDDDDLTEASAMPAGAAGPSGSSNSLDHFVDAIATKIVTKGGAATSRFLYDSAAIGLRELVTATKPTKVLAALLNLQGVKTDKMKVLLGDGLTGSMDNLAPNSLRLKPDLLVRAIKSADQLIHDAHPDVRESGKKLCRALAQYCNDSHEPIKPIVMKHVGGTQPLRAEELLKHCVAVQASDAELMAVGGGVPSTPGPMRDATVVSPQAQSPRRTALNSNPASAATSPQGANMRAKSMLGHDEPPPLLPPALMATNGNTSSASAAAGTTTPPPASGAPKSGRRSGAPVALGSTKAPSSRAVASSPHEANDDSSATSGNNSFADRGSSFDRSPKDAYSAPPAGGPASSTDTQSTSIATTTSSAVSPRLAKDPPPAATPSRFAAMNSPRVNALEATQTNNALFGAGGGGNNSFFAGTLGQNIQAEHGEYSQSLFLAAEGSSADRQTALINLCSLLRRRLQDEQLCKTPVPNETAFALCDVIALRCADTSNKVQLAALELVEPLFRCVNAAVVDATSPRWVSCLTSALASGYTAVHGTAAQAMTALLQRSTDANLRNLCQTICMTCATVRNVNAKVQLTNALTWVIRTNRNHFDHAPLSPDASSVTRIGLLTRSDLDFSTETALRIWCNDGREEVRRVVGNLLCALLDAGWEGDEGRILDNKRLDATNWGQLKELFDKHRAASATSPSKRAAAK
jgi:hypothetical protein